MPGARDYIFQRFHARSLLVLPATPFPGTWRSLAFRLRFGSEYLHETPAPPCKRQRLFGSPETWRYRTAGQPDTGSIRLSGMPAMLHRRRTCRGKPRKGRRRKYGGFDGDDRRQRNAARPRAHRLPALSCQRKSSLPRVYEGGKQPQRNEHRLSDSHLFFSVPTA